MFFRCPDQLKSLTASVMIAVLLVWSLPLGALANPIGGNVSAGNATITESGKNLDINQTSSKVVIDWRSFDIAPDEKTQFYQPSSSAIALNRVGGSNASAIMGTLKANGNVVIINPNGVVFGAGSKVDVNGLVATTADTSNDSFMNNDKLVLNKPGNPNASIINNGTITAKEAGLVGLVAPNVVNNGIITANLGRVQLASGDTATVDLYGDKLMEVAVSDDVKSQLVSNSGLIQANGGRIALTSAAGAKIVNSLITVDGELTAPATVEKNGEILIYAAGDNSKVNVSGKLSANGGMTGNGGKVSITGEGDVNFSGRIEAKGGSVSGNGGKVETSGKKSLSVSGQVDASAAHGNAGDWVIDPTDINIVTGGGSNIAASTIDPGTIVSALNGTNVTLTADNSITVTNAINASGNASGGNLILNAPTDFLNAAITLKNGSTLSGSATTVNVGASGLVQNGVDAAADKGTVNLSAATYTLAAQVTIGKNLILNGNGAILDANNASRVMEIDGTVSGIAVNLDRVTLENGNAGTDGGGLYINSANNTATVNISNSTIANNSAASGGGGIFNDGIGGNTTLTINNSTLSGNTALYGGAIQNFGFFGNATLTINNSTISGNSATGGEYGGGIFNNGQGGNAVLTINNSTIVNNSGGGLANWLPGGGSASVTISDTILSNNTSGGNELDFSLNSGTLTSNGYNLFGQNGDAGGFTGNGTTDILLSGGINTVLSGLANNGGPTKTMALVNGSAAIGAGGSNTGYQLDQRGLTRPISSAISIGAYEYNGGDNPFVVTSISDSGTFGTLRGALNYANANSSLNPTISFDSSLFATQQTITLTNGALVISSSLVLNAPSVGLIIDANHNGNVFDITGTTSGINVVLNNLIMKNGFGGNGGGMYINSTSGKRSTVTINNSTIRDNAAYNGNGIYSDGGSGGYTVLNINNSSIYNNTGGGSGGGLYSDGGGGGYAVLNVNNSTITNNSATNGAGIQSGTDGGGTAILNIYNSTISGNAASANGGAMLLYGVGGTSVANIGNSIIAGNSAGGTENEIANFSTTVNSKGNNLYGQNGDAGGFTGNGTTDILLNGNINTVLSALADNGGLNKTLALVNGSAAIGAGAAQAEFAMDQRGQLRLLSGGDIGAYEYNVANPYLITSTADSSTAAIGTLRTALDYANHFQTNPTITTNFTTPQTITLTQGELIINTSLILNGGAHGLTIDANNASRVLEIDGTNSGITVNLDNLTLKNGTGVGGSYYNDRGGALLVYAESGKHAAVALDNITFENNHAQYGGGMFDDSLGGTNTLTINNSLFTGNSAGEGGGAWIDGRAGSATINVSNTTFTGNTANTGGGFLTEGVVTSTIDASTFTGNAATGDGGAIYNLGYFAGNSNMTISNSTITGNTANRAAAIMSNGYSGTAVLNVNNTTISGNSATTSAGAVMSSDATSTTFANSIIAGNTANGAESDYVNNSGNVMASSGYNLFGQNGDSGGFVSAAHDILLNGNINTVLSALANNGGLTQTMALVSGSVAIDAGDPNSTVVNDQRGLARGANGLDAGSRIDIGAYEASSSILVNNTYDDGRDNSLRSAINVANNLAGGVLYNARTNATFTPTITFDTSVFNTAKTITLAQGQLVINSNLILNGSTAGVTIDANHNSRVMEIDGTLAGITVDLNNLTMENGNGLGAGGTGGRINGYGGGLLINAEGSGRKAYVTLNNSAISNNTSNGNDGGGIYSDSYSGGDARLTINNSTVSNNTANNGAGIYVVPIFYGHGDLTVNNSTISGNSANGSGGAIYLLGGNGGGSGNNGSGTTTLNNTTIYNNSANNNGGAIYNRLGVLVVGNSTISSNIATNGGGIYNDGSSSGGNTALTITNSTISANHASSYGGGIYNDGSSSGDAELIINNSLIASNYSSTCCGGQAGGGVYNSTGGTATINNATITGNYSANYGGGGVHNAGTMTITNSTISGNTLQGALTGGGVFNEGTLTMGNTILIGNTSASSPAFNEFGNTGTFIDNGYNLFGQNGDAGGFVGNGTTDILLGTGVNTVLSALANNGGPTQTMALVHGSAAIDAGDLNSLQHVDQRGFARGSNGVDAGSRIDIGAYEASSSILVNNTYDDGRDNSLRSAINVANNLAGGVLYNARTDATFTPTITFDTSVFNTAKTITLAQGELIINSSLVLDGGNYGVVIDANNASRVMEIDGTSNGITVELNNLTLENGNGSGTNLSSGGGALLIYAYDFSGFKSATVNVNNSKFLNNSASNGGAIYDYAFGQGDVGTLTINNSTLSGNTVSGTGGAIGADGTSNGAAIITINNSTISGNSAAVGGGITGVANFAINNSTITGNNASWGGAIDAQGSYNISNSTISGNTANNGGGGINNDGAGISISNTILAGNTQGGSESDLRNQNGTFASNGYNLYGQNGDAGGFVAATHDILLTGNISTVLSALANNGGLTQTMALVQGSAAIDAGDPNSTLVNDQRGLARGSKGLDAGAHIDIGAYEASSSILVNNTFDDGRANSLRAAIDVASSLSGGVLYNARTNATFTPTINFDTSVFNTAKTITLAQGELVINSSLTLDGGAYGVVLDANNASRVMEIDGNARVIDVTLNRLAFENGNGTGRVRSGDGGGLLIDSENGYTPNVTINNSSFYNNTAGQGGAIGIDASSTAINTTINNTTITNNTANNGGAILIADSGNGTVTTIANSTITGNSANNTGGIRNYKASGSSTVVISNTIIAGNSAGSSESDYTNDGGALVSNGYNLFGQNGDAGGFVGNGTTDILLGGSINTVLNALADNGGPTQTMALKNGSVAIGAGGTQSEFATDQRGQLRLLSGGDIGAYEYNIANPYLITSTADSGTPAIGTLRTALDYANHFGTNPTITTNFSTPQTITLDGSQLLITSSLTLDGGSHGVILDANNASRVMEIDGSTGGVTVSLDNLTLKNCNGVGTKFSGAGGALTIYSESGKQAVVNINHSTITDSSSSGGGGILNDGGNNGSSILNISNSLIANNFAPYGGGIYNRGESGGSAATNIDNSTLTGNTATNGAAIWNAASSGNGSITISSSTISGNTASTLGGGVVNDGRSSGNAELVIGSSILAGNTANGAESDYDNFTNSGGATLTSNGYNLYGQNGNDGGFVAAAHDILLGGNISTVLSTLADNGGQTKTMAIKLGSVAIDAGNATGVDQRGFTRASSAAGTGSAADIGAYEAAVLSVSADDIGKIYGQATPSLTYTLDNGPTGHLSGALALGGSYTNVGVYNGGVVQGTLAADTGYLLDFTAGNYTIAARDVTVNPTAGQNKIFGVADPAILYTTAAANGTSGLVNGDSLGGALDYSGSGLQAVVGQHAITLGSLSNSNYNIILSGGTFEVISSTPDIPALPDTVVQVSQHDNYNNVVNGSIDKVAVRDDEFLLDNLILNLNPDTLADLTEAETSSGNEYNNCLSSIRGLVVYAKAGCKQ